MSFKGQASTGHMQLSISTLNMSAFTAGLTGFRFLPASTPDVLDFKGFIAGSTKDAQDVYTNTFDMAILPPAFANKGLLRFVKVGAGTTDVWFGEWSRTDHIAATPYRDRTVFFAGLAADTMMPSGALFTLATKGVCRYAEVGALQGTLSAESLMLSVGGTLENAAKTFKLDLGSVMMGLDGTVVGTQATVTHNGATVTGGQVKGQFYNNHQQLCGTVTFADVRFNVAFGGAR